MLSVSVVYSLCMLSALSAMETSMNLMTYSEEAEEEGMGKEVDVID